MNEEIRRNEERSSNRGSSFLSFVLHVHDYMVYTQIWFQRPLTELTSTVAYPVQCAKTQYEIFMPMRQYIMCILDRTVILHTISFYIFHQHFTPHFKCLSICMLLKSTDCYICKDVKYTIAWHRFTYAIVFHYTRYCVILYLTVNHVIYIFPWQNIFICVTQPFLHTNDVKVAQQPSLYIDSNTNFLRKLLTLYRHLKRRFSLYVLKSWQNDLNWRNVCKSWKGVKWKLQKCQRITWKIY